MFVLLALGSRGDVQPMAHVAAGLTAAGHEATVIALAEFADLVAARAPGARFVAIEASLADALDRTPWQDTLAQSPAGQYLLLRRWTSAMADSFTDVLLGTVTGPGDVVVTGVLTRGAAMACVASLGCRMATIVYTGQLPTLQRESFFAPQYFSGWRPYDSWGVHFAWQLATSIGSTLTEAVRRRLGLPRIGSRTITRLADAHRIVVAASPLLVPPAADWPASARQTGYLSLPADPWQPTPELEAFLAREPVYVGFGSFTQFTLERDLAAITSAARLSGRSVVTLAPPGAEPGLLDERVLTIAAAPFEQLFGRVAATIHHGGAGTSHEALRSGRPTAVVPFGVDQPYHASRLHALGLGPEPGRLRASHLDADDLARLVDAMTTGPRAAGYAERARELGEQARDEDGLAATVEVLTEIR